MLKLVDRARTRNVFLNQRGDFCFTVEKLRLELKSKKIVLKWEREVGYSFVSHTFFIPITALRRDGLLPFKKSTTTIGKV